MSSHTIKQKVIVYFLFQSFPVEVYYIFEGHKLVHRYEFELRNEYLIYIPLKKIYFGFVKITDH